MQPDDGPHTEDSKESYLARSIYVKEPLGELQYDKDPAAEPYSAYLQETKGLPTVEQPLVIGALSIYFSNVEFYHLGPDSALSPLYINISGPKGALFELLEKSKIKDASGQIYLNHHSEKYKYSTYFVNLAVVLIHELSLCTAATDEEYHLARKMTAIYCQNHLKRIEGLYISGNCNQSLMTDSNSAAQKILNILTSNIESGTRLSDALYIKYLELNLRPMCIELERFHKNILEKFKLAIRAHALVLAESIQTLSQSKQRQTASSVGLFFQFGQVCLSTVGYDVSSELKTKSHKMHEIERLSARIEYILSQSSYMRAPLDQLVEECLPKETRMFDRGMKSTLSALLTEHTEYSKSVLTIYSACRGRLTSQAQLSSAFIHANNLRVDINSLPDVVKSSPQSFAPALNRAWR